MNCIRKKKENEAYFENRRKKYWKKRIDKKDKKRGNLKIQGEDNEGEVHSETKKKRNNKENIAI